MDKETIESFKSYGYVYNFPQNNRASSDVRLQLLKCCEELEEVFDETQRKPQDTVRLLEETMDLIHAAEGILRLYPRTEVKRGDYDS